MYQAHFAKQDPSGHISDASQNATAAFAERSPKKPFSPNSVVNDALAVVKENAATLTARGVFPPSVNECRARSTARAGICNMLSPSALSHAAKACRSDPAHSTRGPSTGRPIQTTPASPWTQSALQQSTKPVPAGTFTRVPSQATRRLQRSLTSSHSTAAAIYTALQSAEADVLIVHKSQVCCACEAPCMSHTATDALHPRKRSLRGSCCSGSCCSEGLRVPAA